MASESFTQFPACTREQYVETEQISEHGNETGLLICAVLKGADAGDAICEAAFIADAERLFSSKFPGTRGTTADKGKGKHFK